MRDKALNRQRRQVAEKFVAREDGTLITAWDLRHGKASIVPPPGLENTCFGLNVNDHVLLGACSRATKASRSKRAGPGSAHRKPLEQVRLR
jgi:hypothetical protein